MDEIMQTIRKDSPECMADDKAPSVHLMAVQCVAELTKYSAGVCADDGDGAVPCWLWCVPSVLKTILCARGAWVPGENAG